MERPKHILLEQIELLPEAQQRRVNMTAVMGMIATEQVARQAAEDSEKVKLYEEYPINLWEKS